MTPDIPYPLKFFLNIIPHVRIHERMWDIGGKLQAYTLYSAPEEINVRLHAPAILPVGKEPLVLTQ